MLLRPSASQVVHVNAGTSGLVLALLVGPRLGHDKKKPITPQNLQTTFIGASMLWVGWFGFNGGSAGAANSRACMAIFVTQLAASTAALSWTLTELYFRGRPSLLGMVTGSVCGLVAITPASGFVNQTGGFFIGLIGGVACFFGCRIKNSLGFDDTLDAFGVHTIGGIVGGVLTGFFATSEVYKDGVFYEKTVARGGYQVAFQLYGIVITIAWSAVGSYLIGKLVDKAIGLRVTPEVELIGADIMELGEHFDTKTVTPVESIGSRENSTHARVPTPPAASVVESGGVPMAPLHHRADAEDFDINSSGVFE